MDMEREYTLDGIEYSDFGLKKLNDCGFKASLTGDQTVRYVNISQWEPLHPTLSTETL